MYKILEEDLTPPRALDATFPEGLEPVLIKALAKDANDRYQTAVELREALLEYLASTRRPYADKHIAELVGSTLGSTLKERNRSILTTAERLLRGEIEPVPLAAPAGPTLTEALTPDGGIERSVTVKRKKSPLRTIATLALAGAVGTLLVLGVLAKVGEPPVESDKPPLAATAAPEIAPTPVPASAPEVSPPPLVEPAPVAAPMPSAVSPPPRRRGGSSVRPMPASAPSSDSVPIAKPPAKKPRPIDRDNPFATNSE
jgi:hypothetical protein